MECTEQQYIIWLSQGHDHDDDDDGGGGGGDDDDGGGGGGDHDDDDDDDDDDHDDDDGGGGDDDKDDDDDGKHKTPGSRPRILAHHSLNQVTTVNTRLMMVSNNLLGWMFWRCGDVTGWTITRYNFQHLITIRLV